MDLDRMLDAVKAGQWSVDDFDWSVPLAGLDGISASDRREAGRALVFTARLERQAANIFALAAEFADDPRVRAIYELFAIDERRHADAEVLLAKRYGVAENDLPVPLDLAMRVLESGWNAPRRALHEISSASIILFELALDSLLIPALKDLTNDPLQARVFRLIDLDESRHLAMDYWLLDTKGERYAGRDARSIMNERPPPGPSSSGLAGLPLALLQRARGRWELVKTLGAMLVAFGTTTVTMPMLRRAARGKRMDRYVARVTAIPQKAPHALDLATFRMAMYGQRRILGLMARLGANA